MKTRPRYTLSRRAFWASFWLAWLVMLTLLGAGIFGHEAWRAAALSLAPIYVPSMVLMVGGVLGIHRAFGAMDYRTQAASPTKPEGEGE